MTIVDEASCRLLIMLSDGLRCTVLGDEIFQTRERMHLLPVNTNEGTTQNKTLVVMSRPVFSCCVDIPSHVFIFKFCHSCHQ